MTQRAPMRAGYVRPHTDNDGANMLDIDDDDALEAAPADNDAPPGPDGPTHVTRELECVLNDTETRERGEAMAADEREIERLKVRRKSLNAQIRAKYDRMTELATAIDSGKEMREVPCTWRPDYKRKVWTLTRDDTGKTVTERAMSSLDLQTRLPIDGPDDDDGDDDEAGTGEPEHDDTTPEGDADYEPDPDAQLTAADVLDARDTSTSNVVELLPAESTPEARAVMLARSAGRHPNGLTEAEHTELEAAARSGRTAAKRATKSAAPTATKRATKVRTRGAQSQANGKRR